MRIFYPSNPERGLRAQQLSTDVHRYLDVGREEYERFKALNAELLPLLNGILKPDAVQYLPNKVNIPGGAGTVDVAVVVEPIEAVVLPPAEMIFIQPAVLTLLIRAGVITEAKAAEALIDIFKGAIQLSRGNAIAAVVSAIVVTTAALAVNAVIAVTQGRDEKAKLCTAIRDLIKARHMAWVTKHRLELLNDGLRQVKAAFNTLRITQTTLTREQSDAAVRAILEPVMKAVDTVDEAAACVALMQADIDRQSYVDDDVDASKFDGDFAILSAPSTNRCLNIRGGTRDNGAEIIAYPGATDANSRWSRTDAKDGQFALRSRATGMVINVAGEAAAWRHHNDVIQWNWDATENERFTFFAGPGESFFIACQPTRMVMQAVPGAQPEFSRVEMDSPNGAANQFWLVAN